MNKERVTEIIYKNSHDTGEGLVIDFKNIQKVIDLLSESPQPSAPSEVVAEKEKSDKIDKLIDRHIGVMWGGLEMASVDYFKQTGTINGSFRLRLISLLKFYESYLKESCQPSAPSVSAEGLRQALEDIIIDWSERMQGDIEEEKEGGIEGMGKYWSPSSSLVSSKFIAQGRQAMQEYAQAQQGKG